jgi:hypothetical protein
MLYLHAYKCDVVYWLNVFATRAEFRACNSIAQTTGRSSVKLKWLPLAIEALH